jgi:hypothetical protein
VRFIKMLGLAAVAAIAAMAFIGVSSAMATELEEVVLCKEDPNLTNDKCPTGKDFLSGTVIHGELESGTTAVFLSEIADVTCTKSTLLNTTTALLVHGEITALGFGGCTLSNGLGCSVLSEHLNYLAVALLNEAHNGYHMVISEHGTNGLPQIHIECAGIFLNCKLSSQAILFTAELKTNDTVLNVLQELEVVSPFCGERWILHAKYLVRCLENTTLVGCWPKMEPLA